SRVERNRHRARLSPCCRGTHRPRRGLQIPWTCMAPLGVTSWRSMLIRGVTSMRKIALLCATLFAPLALVLPATPGHAANAVSAVSGSGTDINNNCLDQTFPCLTFAHALANTNPGGEIICVGGDVMDFGFTTIAQSVTIDCGGVVGISLGGI